MRLDPRTQAILRRAAGSRFIQAVRRVPSRTLFSAAAGCLMALMMVASPPAVAPQRPAQALRAEHEGALRAAEIERLAVHIARTWRLPQASARRIVAAASEHARRTGLSPTLILAVVAQESGFRPKAQSRKGALGLMQVMAHHHRDKLKGLRHDALLRPEVNIRVGSTVLAEYLERSNGRLDRALARYSGNASAYARKVRLAWADFERVRRTRQA